MLWKQTFLSLFLSFGILVLFLRFTLSALLWLTVRDRGKERIGSKGWGCLAFIIFVANLAFGAFLLSVAYSRVTINVYQVHIAFWRYFVQGSFRFFILVVGTMMTFLLASLFLSCNSCSQVNLVELIMSSFALFVLQIVLVEVFYGEGLRELLIVHI